MMETIYRILNLYKTKQYDECLKLCTETDDNEHIRMIEFIRMRVETIKAKIASNAYEEVGYGAVNDDLVTTAVAKTPRPGTTFQKTAVKSSNILTSYRATTTARRMTGTSTSGVHSARSALITARASRAATAISGGPVTPGAPLTLTLLTKQDKLFAAASKTLFEYVFYVEGNIRKALELASQVQKCDNNPDWWWDSSTAKCYLALGMHRSAEESLRLALRKNKHIAIYLRLVAMFVSINQPITALEVCKQGLSVFHEDTALLTEQARIQDEMGNTSAAIQDYRRVALEDPTNMEAIANIAMYNFYNDQPEIALRYYRRLIATCPVGAEIYNNLGLCCLYCNQWDLIIPCFRQAIYFSTTPQTQSDIWFNIAHVALSTGDLLLAKRCLQASLALSSENTAARNGLRALEARTGDHKLTK